MLGIVNKIAPSHLAEEWDNVGLQVGDGSLPVDRIMVALDPTPDTLVAARDADCQLLLTHHPLIFKPLSRISTSDIVGSLVIFAIRYQIAVIAAHTNYDAATGGLNDSLAALVGIEQAIPLRPALGNELVKLVTFVPAGHEENVLSALYRVAPQLGAYADCSFRAAGTGTFRPLAGADPFIGKVGERQEVAEYRLELLLQRSDTASAIKALRKVHPYEEPAIDLIPLVNPTVGVGMGRIGHLLSAMPLAEFCVVVKERLGCASLRLAGKAPAEVHKVAVCGGSGASLMRDAARQGAQILVTGDVKYHEAREAEELGIALLDAGHFATERIMVRAMAGMVRHALSARRLETEVIEFNAEQEPFSIV
ncbi:MAG TPA: Nif3-like dinuclear metal center hexameric protein [Geobacterales bacterium]|nr:Nif3-like dinuclear metal center hexameric protein [Geobacterales bacterium]